MTLFLPDHVRHLMSRALSERDPQAARDALTSPVSREPLVAAKPASLSESVLTAREQLDLARAAFDRHGRRGEHHQLSIGAA